MNVILGKTDTNNDLQLGDIERRNGVYILGKPRMGKSWLIINMILQDHEKQRGVFFIDPHGDAIDQLLTHANTAISPYKIYDFEDEERILCINPLAGIRSDPAVRNQIFAKTKALFDKLWRNTFEEKPWLQLIIQNTIYVFIENIDFTLIDFTLFFRDRDFRDYLVSNMQYNIQVKDYWLARIAALCPVRGPLAPHARLLTDPDKRPYVSAAGAG